MTELMRDVVLTDDTVRGLELLASSLDWPCYVVDLRGCVDKAQLLERCAEVLRFPSWLGGRKRSRPCVRSSPRFMRARVR